MVQVVEYQIQKSLVDVVDRQSVVPGSVVSTDLRAEGHGLHVERSGQFGGFGGFGGFGEAGNIGREKYRGEEIVKKKKKG